MPGSTCNHISQRESCLQFVAGAWSCRRCPLLAAAPPQSRARLPARKLCCPPTYRLLDASCQSGQGPASSWARCRRLLAVGLLARRCGRYSTHGGQRRSGYRSRLQRPGNGRAAWQAWGDVRAVSRLQTAISQCLPLLRRQVHISRAQGPPAALPLARGLSALRVAASWAPDGRLLPFIKVFRVRHSARAGVRKRAAAGGSA